MSIRTLTSGLALLALMGCSTKYIGSTSAYQSEAPLTIESGIPIKVQQADSLYRAFNPRNDNGLAIILQYYDGFPFLAQIRPLATDQLRAQVHEHLARKVEGQIPVYFTGRYVPGGIFDIEKGYLGSHIFNHEGIYTTTEWDSLLQERP